MSIAHFTLSLTTLDPTNDDQRAAIEHVTSLFHTECDPGYIYLDGTIKFICDNNTLVPYSSIFVPLPASWDLDSADIDTISMDAHEVNTDVPNMPRIKLAFATIDPRTIPKEHLAALEDMVDEYYDKNFKEFEKIAQGDNDCDY